MRRLASVFGRRDKDSHKHDLKRANSIAPSAPSVSLVSSLPPTPALSDPASSTSSTGSASLQTPDDDPVLRTPGKGKWSSWLGKKSGTIKRARPAEETWINPVPEWRPPQSAPLLHAPPAPNPKPQPPQQPVVDGDSDDDASSSESDDDDSVSLSHPAPLLPHLPPITPTSVAQSRKNLEILIQNSLVPPFAPSPFLHPAGSLPFYPRSCNSPQSLPACHTMQSVMHKTLLLRRLQHPDVSALTDIDESILPFASRLSPIPVDPPSPLPWFNDRYPSATATISPSSPGLRRWMARPCFEERFAVWVPLNGAVTREPVAGSSLAVAELEYSFGLDAMVGFGLSPVEEEEQVLPVAPVATPPVAATIHSRNTPYIAVPSPLRNSTLKSPVPSTSSSSTATPVPVARDVAPTTSRVRFVEDDKDDVIPLGYALRVKKRREEKAKFLREEQERRAFEEERARQQQERMRREKERMQWEEEKRAWEREKKAMEEERKQRIYAEEVAAARLRRENQRAGGGHGANSSTLAASSSTPSLRGSTASLRGDERNKHEPGRYSRPLHDQHGPRRQASEPAVPRTVNTPSSSPLTSSPGSSRPPSVAGHRRNSSRPASVHTSSSEDARPQSTSVGKRASITSIGLKAPNIDRSSSYGLWASSNPTLMVPPVPPVPMYAMDMPLLPPTPPFMLHQYPRQSSQNGSSPSRSSPSSSPSRQRQPSNGSSDKINVQHQSSSPHGSTSSLHKHERRGSDDPRRASLPPPKTVFRQDDRNRSRTSVPPHSQSSTSLSRGRPAVPSASQLHPPTPWTAPPLTTSYSQQQLSPAAIISGYSARHPPSTTRRQTTIS
ncbi:hypothetical protein C8J57DRAFT_1292893 [Mycena rebaudengoi]|nr:hypothetical protein C8J57DRAFT_1292893 [Mycena rebaudengoi]